MGGDSGGGGGKGGGDSGGGSSSDGSGVNYGNAYAAPVTSGTSISEQAAAPPGGVGIPIASAGGTLDPNSGATSGAGIGGSSFDIGSNAFSSLTDPASTPSSSGVNTPAQFIANPGAALGVTGSGPGASGATAFTAPAGAAPQLGADPTAALSGGTADASLFNPASTASTGGLSPAGTGGFSPAGSNPVNTTAVGGGSNLLSPAQLGGGPSTPAPSSGGGLSLDSLTSGASKSINSNPLGLALAAGGLGFNAYEGQKQTAAVNNLSQQASQANANAQPLIAQGEQLAGYLQSGTLPPGYQAQVDQAIASAKTNAISNAANQGLSTDPTKNTALAATLAQIDQQAPILTAQIGQQLLTSGEGLIGTGVQASGLSSSIYTTLANIDQTQTAAVGKAIANMAAALSGKSGVSTPAGSFTFSPGSNG
jgi:hypothetical protein